jgi:hypothetical protein
LKVKKDLVAEVMKVVGSTKDAVLNRKPTKSPGTPKAGK